MLTILNGGFFSDACDFARDELRSRILEKKSAGGPDGRRFYYIVPEQQTLSTESALTRLLPSDYPLYLEVTNFTRLANTVFRELGGLAESSADSLRRALLIYRAISEMRPKLKALGTASVTSGTVDKTLGAIRKMQSLSISEEELHGVAGRLAGDALSSRLCDKLSDLSLIMSEYNRIVKEKYGTAEDTLDKLHTKITEGGKRVFSGSTVYIEGFTSFTEGQYTVIRDLLSLCDVCVILTLPDKGSDAFEFTEVKQTRARLESLARRADVDARRISRPDGERGVPALRSYAKNLWRSFADIDNSNLHIGEDLRIFEADNPYDECDFVASDIKRRIMESEGGENPLRYRDFAILARKQDAYGGILSLSFEKAGIPLFVAEPDSIASYEIMKLITSALSCISSSFSRSDVTAYAKCSLGPLSRDEADELELYTDRWQIDKAAFTSSDAWLMNPDGFDSHRNEKTEQRLKRINEIRDKLITPLLSLQSDFRSCPTVRARTAALFSHISALGVQKRLADKAKRLRALGRTRDAEGAERIYALVISTLDAIVEVLGELECTDDGYISILSLAFAECKLSRIPSYTDQVVAGSVDTARLSQTKHVYIIGASFGTLPMRISDDGYFEEAELLRIMSERAGSTPDGTEKYDEPDGCEKRPELTLRCAMEYFYISRAFSVSSESLTLLYPTYDAAASPLKRSDLIDRLIALTDGRVTPVRISSLPESERIYTPHYALEHLHSGSSKSVEAALTDFGMGELITRTRQPISNATARISASTLSLLYKDALAMTQTRLDSYSACPMRYFLSTNMHLDDGERARFGANNIGTFIHAVLEYFFKELKTRGMDIASLDKDERRALTLSAARSYASQCLTDAAAGKERINTLINRLSRHALPIVDSLCDEFSSCKYEPTFFELKINKLGGRGDGAEPIVFKSTDGREIYVYGTIDRVDTYKSGDRVYVRVIDYKTGRKSFSPSDLEKGENLQMFLYLKSVVESKNESFRQSLGASEGDELIPAGVLYVKTDLSKVSVAAGESPEDKIKEKQARLGMLLNEQESIDAMNRDFIPIKYKKDGLPDAASQSRLYSIDGWGELSGTVEDSVRKICDSILSGEISALPLKRGGKSVTCDYCRFKAVCRNSK